MTKFVAALAIVLAMLIATERRRQSFLRRANELSDKYSRGAQYAGMSREAREQARKQNEYYLQLNKKYVRAARYPWLPVDPDPPMPGVAGGR
jgi:hypothetical protein